MLAIAERTSSNRPPATPPSIAAPSNTGSSACVASTGLPVASASSCRTRSSRPAPPLITTRSIGAPAMRLRFDDLAKAVTDTANAGNVEGDQTVQIILHSKARNHGSCVRVGQRGPVTQELRNDMQAVGQHRRPRQAVRRLHGETGEHHRQGLALVLCATSGVGGCGVHRKQSFDRRARYRLPALVEPCIGHHRRKIRPPHAGHEDRTAGRGHRAR